MGGPRASTVRQISHGLICTKCHRLIRAERACPQCEPPVFFSVFLTFIHRDGWHVNFLDSDARSVIPWARNYASPEPIRRIIMAAENRSAALLQFDSAIKQRGQGSVALVLTAAQYKRLRETGMGRKPPKSAR